MLITRISVLTGAVRTRDLPVTQSQLETYDDGALIQMAFPDLDAEDREFIRCGVSRAEWEAVHGRDPAGAPPEPEREELLPPPAFDPAAREKLAKLRGHWRPAGIRMRQPTSTDRGLEDAAWLWLALNDGWISARRAAAELEMLLDDIGDAFVAMGFPRPGLM